MRSPRELRICLPPHMASQCLIIYSSLLPPNESSKETARVPYSKRLVDASSSGSGGCRFPDIRSGQIQSSHSAIEFADKVTHEMIHSGSRIISLRSSRLGTGLALDMSQRGKTVTLSPIGPPLAESFSARHAFFSRASAGAPCNWY